MKVLRATICAMLLVILLAPCAMAVSAPAAGLTCAADAQGNFISLQKVGGEDFLFLPSTADLTALTFYFEGGPAALTAVGGETAITSGQPFDLTALYSGEPDDGVYAFIFRVGSE